MPRNKTVNATFKTNEIYFNFSNKINSVFMYIHIQKLTFCFFATKIQRCFMKTYFKVVCLCMRACMRICVHVCVCVVCAYGDAWGVGTYEEHRSSSQEHCPLLRQCLSWWSAAHQWSWAWLPGPCGLCLPISGVIRTYQPAHPFCLGPEMELGPCPCPCKASSLLSKPSNPIPIKLQNTILCILQKRQKNKQSRKCFTLFTVLFKVCPETSFHWPLPAQGSFHSYSCFPAPQIFN